MGKAVIILGGPDSGKSNYLGRLWHALDTKSGQLVAVGVAPDLSFPMDTADHLFQGHFAPHTGRGDSRRDLSLTVRQASGGEETKLLVPDFSGELWTSAVRDSEIAAEWMEELKSADGALLFVRVGSDQNIKPLDWVTSSAYLKKIGQNSANNTEIPTQVLLCELIRFLEHTMASGGAGKPRLSIVVAAWDRVDAATFTKGPVEYLQREYPMFGGRLDDLEALEVRVFGLSIVGGDLKDDLDFRTKFLEEGIDGTGWVAVPDGNGLWVKDPDLTMPVAWAMGA